MFCSGFGGYGYGPLSSIGYLCFPYHSILVTNQV